MTDCTVVFLPASVGSFTQHVVHISTDLKVLQVEQNTNVFVFFTVVEQYLMRHPHFKLSDYAIAGTRGQTTGL